MEKSSIYHRPESEYAYLYSKNIMHIRLRTKRDDVDNVRLHFGDTYLWEPEDWQFVSMDKIATTDLFDYWQAAIEMPYRRVIYVFECCQQEEVVWYGDEGFYEVKQREDLEFTAYFRLPYWHEIDRVHTPEWVKSTIWYQIFPERFANGNPDINPENVLPWDPSVSPNSHDFFGGDIQGIMDHLDYLQELGINGLYLCPIFISPSNHKYDTIDYYTIDPHFGDKETFKRFVKEAHRRGMRIMLDAVFNHIGARSKQWQDVLEKGPDSKYADWFHIRQFPVAEPTISEKEHRQQGITYDMFAFVSQMPKFNTANPEVKKFLLDIATYWIREFDIDGWRLDVANEVDHQFWREFYQAVRGVKDDVYILGEIWHNAQNWLSGGELDSVMNYLGTNAIKRFFLQERLQASDVVNAVWEQQLLYRRQVNEVMFNLLDSHDTERMLTTAKGLKHRVKSALAFMFLQIGTPCIYYGTEVGVDGVHDPGCRKVMPWLPEQQDQEMYRFVQGLIHLRHKYNEWIQYGHVRYETQGRVLKMMMDYQGETLVAHFNFEQQTQVIKANMDILCGEGYQIENHQLVLKSESFIVYKQV